MNALKKMLGMAPTRAMYSKKTHYPWEFVENENGTVLTRIYCVEEKIKEKLCADMKEAHKYVHDNVQEIVA